MDFPYVVDAEFAVGHHPDEWSWKPWSPEAVDAVRARSIGKRLAPRPIRTP
jgi:hypothetical protein